MFKFGLYEVFKDYYSTLAGEENAFKYRGLIYLAGSASAEFFADVALCPWEMMKVKIQSSEAGTFPTGSHHRRHDHRHHCHRTYRIVEIPTIVDPVIAFPVFHKKIWRGACCSRADRWVSVWVGCTLVVATGDEAQSE